MFPAVAPPDPDRNRRRLVAGVRLLSRFAPLIVLVVLGAVATAGVTFNPPFDRHVGPAVAYLVVAALGCALVTVMAVTNRDPARVQSLVVLQTISGLLVTDVVLALVDRIGQIEVWPGAVFVLLTASTRRHRRGALVAWVAVVPALVAGFALRGELLSAVAPAVLLLVLAVTSADQASRLARTRSRLDVAEEALRRHAENDSLTGLLNRSALQNRVALSLTGTAVVALDLHGVREINEAFGHEAGDTVLRTVAERLTLAVSADALVARIGGDDFVIVLPDTTLPAAQAAVERLARVADEPVIIDGGRAPFSVALGLAYGSHAGPTAFEDLLRIAQGRTEVRAPHLN